MRTCEGDGGSCTQPAYSQGLCRKHYQRKLRQSIKDGTVKRNPTCPRCDGLMLETQPPVAVGQEVARVRQCGKCRFKTMTVETPVTRKMIEKLASSRLTTISAGMPSLLDTPAGSEDGAVAESTGPTTSGASG